LNGRSIIGAVFFALEHCGLFIVFLHIADVRDVRALFRLGDFQIEKFPFFNCD